MYWFLRLTALGITIGCALPLLAQDVKKADDPKADLKKADEKKVDDPKADLKKADEKKPTDPKPDDPKKAEDEKDKKDKLLPAGTLQGKITKYDGDKQTMTVEITYYYQKPNNDEYRAMMDAQNRYYQAAAKRDGNGARQAIIDYNTHHGKLFTTEKKTQSVDLQIMEDAKIRVAVPPIAFDDDGKQKKYTKKELDEMKGPDKKLPGYTSDLSQLSTGVQVQVMLVKKKDAKPMPQPKPGGLPKPKDAVATEDALADHLPMVSVVLVLPQVEDTKK